MHPYYICLPSSIYHKALLLFIYVVSQNIVNFLKADTMFQFSVSLHLAENREWGMY